MTVENFDRRLAAGIRWSFLGLAFFLPLVLSTRSSEVFELPKMLFVYAATTVICGLWLMRMVVRREILIRRTPLDIPILLFLLSQIASTIYSIDPYVSWWGWYGRFHGGLVSTISYTLLYYALVSNISVIGFPFSVFSCKFVGYRFTGFKPMDREPINHKPTTENRGLITVILSSAAVVSVYAILQHFGIDKDFWVQDVANRVFSTQGQPNWLAAYLTMALPLSWAIAIVKEEGRRKKEEGLGTTAFYLLPSTFYLALLWTKSRSGLVGLAAADLVFWLLIFFQFYLLKKRSYIDQQRSLRQQPTFSSTKKLYRLSTIVHNLYNFNKTASPAANFFLIHSILIILILAANNPAREYIFQKSQLISAKISSNQIMDKSDKSESDSADLSAIRSSRSSRDSDFSGSGFRKSEHGGTESGDIRRIVWNGALQLVKQRPVFGFGPETFGETYWRVRPKEHNLTSEWNFLYNKAHNEWLNLAANTGLFGLGSHLLSLGWFSVWAMRSFANFSTPEKFAKLNYPAAIMAAIVGVEAVNFFGFSTVTVGVYSYLFMGIAVSSSLRGASATKQSRRDCHAPPRQTRLGLAMTGIPLMVSVFYIISQLFIFFLADLDYNRGRAYQDAGYIEEAVEPLTKAVNLVPGEPVFRLELGEALSAVALRYQISEIRNQKDAMEKDNLSEQLRDEAIKNLEIVRKQSPNNLGFVRTEARVLFLLGNCGQSPGDDLCERAIQLMKLAMEMAPTNPQLPYSLGVMLTKMGKEEEAAVYFNKALELKPDYAGTKQNLK